MSLEPAKAHAESTRRDTVAAPATVAARTIQTLEALAPGPLSAAEVGRILGVNRSTALRLLSELIETGYVSRDPVTKRFALVRPRLMSLVARQSTYADWPNVVTPVLTGIRDETGDATILGVPAERNMVYLAFVPTFHVIAISERIGTVRPMHCSALGKAYLSALDYADLERELSQMTFAGGTHHAANTEGELRARVEQARTDGYALDVDETFEHVRCVAVPVRIDGSPVGAVGITGPASRFAVPRMHELGAYLAERLAAFGPASPPGGRH